VPPGPRRQGYEFWAGNECSHAHFNNWYFRDTPERIDLKSFETQGYAEVGIEFLQEAKKDRRPWYLTVQWGPPHDPYKAPEEYRRRYDPSKLSMRPNWVADSTMGSKDDIAHYYAMTTAIDDGVGMMLRALDDLGLAENTVVLFASDHGDMLGSQGRRLKRKPWEESIRVPGIVRWPARMKAGSRWEGFFTHVDFAPTFLGWAGAPVPAEMQGRDLSGAISSGRSDGPDSAFFQIFGPFAGDGTEDGWRGVRTKKHMYARFQERPWVLYDIEKDPYQQRNLASEPSARRLLEEMEGRLKAWMAKTGDSWSYNWSGPIEGGSLHRHKAFGSIPEYLEWSKANPGASAPAKD
jgi:arylsulfatase A-like enzyme